MIEEYIKSRGHSMKEKTWKFIDKSSWPDGPWKTEPDKIQWIDKKTGLDCLMVRNNLMGFWWGYVGVTKEHKHYMTGYNDINNVNVHGDLTFAAKCQQEDKGHGICHIPENGRPNDIWWFGFDCAHHGDLYPQTLTLGFPKLFSNSAKYRDMTYVKKEVRHLARQLI